MLGARRASESASRAALDNLGVFNERRPEHLDEAQVGLRIGLRAKLRQLGGVRELLVSECAYEQWHRLLFARFLAENNLLLHPKYRAPVTLEECNELASELGEPDGWSVAARFAAEILPGIFQLDDPCVRLRLAPEGRDALERVLAGLAAEVFGAGDALGWVYQFWQNDKKDEVNASERKIGGADVGPVTQLFTENYMVRFLLENSLGAWWASRHPKSPLVKDHEYLRFGDDGKPAAGSFDGWPERAAEVTVMDPCCGSGHFLIEAFSMLWQMRVEEEGLSSVDAQDAVLRANLFGLELDPRCVQIAMFNLALQAWKAGGGWRQLPVPNLACSGIPIKSPLEEWTRLAHGDERLENALTRLHSLFRDADTLGSLIDPRRASEFAEAAGLQRSFEDIDWEVVRPLLAAAVRGEAKDAALAVLGADASSSATAAEYLTRRFTLIATNVPYLHHGKHSDPLLTIGERDFDDSQTDLATMAMERCLRGLENHGALVVVAPQNWMSQTGYTALREQWLGSLTVRGIARLGEGAFESPAAAGAFVALYVLQKTSPIHDVSFPYFDAAWERGVANKRAILLGRPLWINQHAQVKHPDARIHPPVPGGDRYLFEYASCLQGIKTGDDGRYRRQFWEVPDLRGPWLPFLSSVEDTAPYGGRSGIVRWEDGKGSMAKSSGARIVGKSAWGRRGVHVSQMRDLPVSIYLGELFDTNASPIVPKDPKLLPAIWAFCSSADYTHAVREIEPALKVTNATLVKVPFDVMRWKQVAATNEPIPEPDRVADMDAIVCLPPVAGEPPAVERLERLLAIAFGAAWSSSKMSDLLEQTGSKKKNLSEWLRDEFFKQHCALFANRPFIWHIWDGQRDGFSALINYHRLDRKTLEKLTYTYLGQDWVERQRSAARDNLAGAEGRLSAALELRRKLEAILAGDKPYDIYVRWKALHEQPIGWEPDLNDGVRLNIRPFVGAGVLRSPVKIDWNKDRGKNPDGSERPNDLHYSLAEKLTARKAAGRE